MVFNRLCDATSKLGCLRWLETVAMPAMPEAVTHQQLLRAMDALMDNTEAVEEALARLQADRGHRVELAEAVEDLSGLVDEGLTWRLSKAAEAKVSASRGPQDQKTESVIAPNGVELDREELDRRQKLFDSIDFSAGGKARPG